jgi:hypothetical protein
MKALWAKRHRRPLWWNRWQPAARLTPILGLDGCFGPLN